jgi:saccharopine dehydrogenase-like NADP-dependent oxidoreductase
MSFKGPIDELKQNELFDLKQKGYFDAGATQGKSVLSAFGQGEFERLVKTLPGKHQVLIRMMVGANTEKTDSELKDFMQQ